MQYQRARDLEEAEAIIESLELSQLAPKRTTSLQRAYGGRHYCPQPCTVIDELSLKSTVLNLNAPLPVEKLRLLRRSSSSKRSGYRKELGPASPTVKQSRKNARFEPQEFKLVFNRLAIISQEAKKERKQSTLLLLPSLSMP